MSASRFIAQRRVHTQGSADKVQFSNAKMSIQSPYRGVLGCGPRDFAQIVQFKPRCSGKPYLCPNPPIPPPPPEPIVDLIFSVSGSIYTGSEVVSQDSIRMYVDEFGDFQIEYLLGTTIVFPIPPPPLPILDLLFSGFGSFWTGTEVVSQDSIRMYVDEFGDFQVEYLLGTTIVFPIPPPLEINSEIVFAESGSIWTGIALVTQDSMHMVVNESGDVILNQQSGLILVFSTAI